MNARSDRDSAATSLLPWFVSGAVLTAIGLLVAYFLRAGSSPSTIGVITHPPAATASVKPKAAPKSPEPSATTSPEEPKTAMTPPPGTAPKRDRQQAAPSSATAPDPAATAAKPGGAPREEAAKPGAPPRETKRAAAPKAPPPTPPRFDIVRVSPGGEMVIAGRADPGARVEVLLNGRPIARLEADERGEWVATPEKALPPGQHEITLRSHVRRGRDSVAVVSEQSVSVAGAGQTGRALVVLTSPDAPSRILQKPEPPKRAAVAQREQTPAANGLKRREETTQPSAQPEVPPGKKSSEMRLTLETVDYDENGDIFFSGSSAPNSRLRLYVDNRHLGDTRADDKGRWSYRGNAVIAPGPHALRVDRVDDDGVVLARVAAPFMRAAPAEVAALKKSLKKEAENTEAKQETPPPASDAATATSEVATAASAEPAARAVVEKKPTKPARVIIQPGDNLWTIARNLYGKGIRYTVIYEANKDQIRDPDLIYPGQIFTTPKPPGG